MWRALFVALLGAIVLAGCGSQQAGYQITDNEHSLSITRSQQYPGATWDTWLVVSRFPDCVRRHELKSTGDKFKMDVYRFEPGVFVLNQGKRWYAAETKTCRSQMYKEAPPEPGVLVGTFQIKGEELVFVGLEKPAANDSSVKKSAEKTE